MANTLNGSVKAATPEMREMIRAALDAELKPKKKITTCAHCGGNDSFFGGSDAIFDTVINELGEHKVHSKCIGAWKKQQTKWYIA